jgi:hypothetical protein
MCVFVLYNLNAEQNNSIDNKYFENVKLKCVEITVTDKNYIKEVSRIKISRNVYYSSVQNLLISCLVPKKEAAKENMWA